MNFGTANLENVQFSPDGDSLIIAVRVMVNSTGWSVQHSSEQNRQKNVHRVKLTVSRPAPGRMSGAGFSTNGNVFTLTVPGPFARAVKIVTPDGSERKIRRP